MVKARGEFTVAPLSDGSDGRGVVSVTTYFLATNLSTGVTTKTSGWGTAFQPLTATKRYLWEYTVTAYDSGSPTTTTPVIKGVYGDKGDDGVSITSMSEEYYYSTSSTTQTGGVWSTTVPDWVDGKYLWLRIKTVYSNSDIGYTKPMNVTGQKGEAGSQGKDKFLWIKYADDEKGSGMSDSGIDKKYIGVSPNQLSEKESDNPSDYKWSPMYDLGALDDITLADKTEILSGTEIYTDKADDSVVHIDIDGKSVGGGSGKNIVLGLPFQSYSSNLSQGRVRVPVNFDSMKSNQGGKITFSFEAKSSVSENASIYVLDLSNYTSKGYHVNNLSIGVVGTEWKTYTVTGNINTNIILDNIAEFTLAHNSANPHDTEVRNIQIEIGSVATAYEPPAPTPDYPIEIHSLNDFDVVSSTAKRNLFVDSSFHNSYESVSGERIIHYSGNRFWSLYNSATSPLLPSGDYTLSFESMVENTGTSIRVNRKDTSGVTRTISYVPIPNTEGVWRRVEYSFNLTEPSPVGIDIYNDPRQLVSVRRIKLERGSNPTLFTLAPEDIQPDTYTPTIYKTNILLSEPLRSLDDVNDKLFRDSDGLWKVERNVAEKIFDGTESISVYPDVQPDTYAFYYVDRGNITGIINGSGFSSHFLREQGDIATRGAHAVNKECYSANANHLKFSISKNRLSSLNILGIKAWLSQENAKGTPLSVIYKSRGSSIETLPQADQDKLNNIASFKGDNYVYTVFDKSDILAPELHATFKSKAWYRNFKTDSNIVNSQADKFKNAQQEKKVLDERYKEIYAHSKLSGNVKTALYNAKVAYNTVFMALEVSLQHYIREKTEVRLSELEAIYSGGNGYVSAKAKLEVALDNAQSNITDGITNDKTGRNKWIGKKYTWTDTVRVAPKLSHIRGLEPVETTAVDDTKKFTFNDDKYLAHFFTYLYLDKAKTIVTTVAHDDSFTMLVNGQEIISTNQTIPTPYAVSIPLSKGWNQIDMLLQEGTGGDHITLGHELSTLVDDMSCYLGGGFSASQIRQLSDEIDMRVQEGNVINAINISTEGIRLEGKKVSIDGNTEFKKDLIMKSGVIQSADGGTRLDLNNNTFTFNKPFTIGSSQVATDKDVKDSIDNLEIGGRNLIKNSNNFTNFGGYSGAKSTFEENVRVPEWGAYDATRIVISGGSSNLKTTPQIYATVGSQVNYSFWAKNMGTKDISFKFNGLNGASEIVLAVDESKRISVFGKMRATIDWFQHQIYTHFSADSVDIILWRSKLEYGNKATGYTVAPEDIDTAISESQKSAEAVAVAKANLAETNAKAHADGVLDKEEKARIAQAQANLNTAMAEAKKKADEAERLAKAYAKTQSDNMLAQAKADATAKAEEVRKSAEAVAIAKANLAEVNSKAHADGIVTAEETARINDVKAKLTQALADAKTKADEAERLAKAYADTKANKALADAKLDATAKADEAKRSAEAVAVAKANLAETNAKAHADGKVTTEEKARIAEAKKNLAEAMAEAKKKADEAERLAKLHADNQVDGIKIGGRNLVLNSKELISGTAYMLKQYNISEDFVEGEMYTLTIKGKTSVNKRFGLWQNAGTSHRGYLSNNMDGTESFTFQAVKGNASWERKLQIYNYPSSVEGEATIEWIKLERGNKATDYTLAPEDIDLAIDNKSDKETTDGLEKALEDLNDVVADIGVDGIREQLVEYQSVLNDVGNDSKNAKDRLEKLLDPANGELNALTVALNELSQRWKTQDGFIQINGDETELSITKGDVSMILGSDGLIFYSGGEAVATINGQYLRIDRGIFAESLHVGRHQWSPLASNRDHFVLSYTTDVRDV